MFHQNRRYLEVKTLQALDLQGFALRGARWASSTLLIYNALCGFVLPLFVW